MDTIALSLACQERCDKIRHVLSGLAINDDQKQKFIETFSSELEAGLKNGLEGSCLQVKQLLLLPFFVDIEQLS
jgi:hypothetical protein